MVTRTTSGDAAEDAAADDVDRPGAESERRTTQAAVAQIRWSISSSGRNGLTDWTNVQSRSEPSETASIVLEAHDEVREHLNIFVPVFTPFIAKLLRSVPRHPMYTARHRYCSLRSPWLLWLG